MLPVIEETRRRPALMRCADDARHFDTVAHEDQRRPQLDLERTPERPPRPIFDLQVTRARMLAERLADDGLRALAVAAPVGAELDDGHARHGIDIRAARRGLRVLVRGSHSCSI